MKAVDWSFFQTLAKRRRTQAIAWSLLILVAGLARLAYGDALAQHVALAFYAMIGLAFLLWIWRTGKGLFLARSFWALAIYTVFMLVMVWHSPIQSHAWESVIDLALLLSFTVLVTTLLAHGADVKALNDALILLALLFSLANLLYLINWLVPWLTAAINMETLPPFGYRLPGAFLGHPNLEAGFLILVIPLTMVRIWRSVDWGPRLLWSAVLGFFLLMLFFSSSRAGWLSGAIGMGATASLIAIAPIRDYDISKLMHSALHSAREHARALLVATLVGSGVLALLWIQVRNTPHAPLAEARGHVWTAGWTIFQQSPWIGHGPGSTHILVVAADRLISEAYFIHPHNLLLFVADEGGLVALLVLGTGLALLLNSLAKSWIRMNGEDRIVAAGGLGALATAAVHHQADILVEAPVYALGLVLIISGLLFSSRDGPAPPLSRLPLGIVSILTLVLLAGQAVMLLGIRPLDLGVQMVLSGEPHQGTARICRAAQVSPNYPVHHIQCGLARSGPGQNEGENAAMAAAAFENGIIRDSYWPAHWINLGVLAWTEGDQSRGMALLREAIERAPHHPRALLTYGWMAERRGDTITAEEVYRTALKHNPALRQAIFFGQSNFRRTIVREHADYEYSNDVERLSLEGWDLLHQGRPEQAQAAFEAALLLSPRSRISRAGSALALQELGREQAAWERTQIATLPGQIGPRVFLASGMVALQQNRSDEGLALLERGWSMLANHSESHRYYSTVYRRSILPWDLVPGAVDPTLTKDMADALLYLQAHYEENEMQTDAREIRNHIFANAGVVE